MDVDGLNIGPGGDSSVYAVNATDQATAAGRVSFVFRLQGPCAAYSTACSSSLVALHAAVRSLQHSDCDLAIVLGVNALINFNTYAAIARAKMITSTGHCHTFDQSADGFCLERAVGQLS